MSDVAVLNQVDESEEWGTMPELATTQTPDASAPLADPARSSGDRSDPNPSAAAAAAAAVAVSDAAAS